MSKNIKLSNNTQDYLYINDVPLIIGDGNGPTGPTGPTGNNSNINYTISTILTNQQYVLYNDVSDCDIYQVDTSENIITIVLPEISTLANQQRKHVFSDVGGKLNINHFIIETPQNSTNTIVGENSLTLTINYSSITIISNTINNWIII